jgi:uncharacterized protein YqgC (DUF456 family)
MDPVLTTSIIIVGLILVLAGFVGCILPIVPGPPLGLIALLLLSFAKDWEPFNMTFWLVMGALTVLVTLLDYVVPVAGAKKYGASKWGVWGSLAGLLVGFFVLPPSGMFVGGFVGNLFGMGLKLGLCGVMLFFYIKELF